MAFLGKPKQVNRKQVLQKTINNIKTITQQKIRNQIQDINPVKIDCGVVAPQTIKAINRSLVNNLATADHRYFGAFLISKCVKAIPEFFDLHQFKSFNRNLLKKPVVIM